MEILTFEAVEVGWFSLMRRWKPFRKKNNPDFGLSFMCKVRFYVFGYTEFSFMQAHLSVRLKESPHVILLAFFMWKFNK